MHAMSSTTTKSERRVRTRTLAAIAVFATIVSLHVGEPASAAPPYPADAVRVNDATAATRPWDQQVIYVLIPDKYFGAMANPRPSARLGGDLPGAVQQVDHIKSMTGLTTVLIYPIFKQQQYVRYYSVIDYGAIDEDFAAPSTTANPAGLLNPYRELIARLHDPNRGPTGALRVMQDLPFSATGIAHPWATGPTPDHTRFRPWETPTGADPYPNVSLTGPGTVDGHQVDRTDNGGFVLDHAGDAQRIMTDVVAPLVNAYGIDGYRFDSVHNTPSAFWPGFIDAMNANYSPTPTTYRFDMLSERLTLHPPRSFVEDDTDYGIPDTAVGQPQVSGGYDGLQTLAIQNVFALDAYAGDLVHSTSQQERRLTASIDNYEACSFRNAVSDPTTKDARTIAALTYLLTNDRVPMLYSGNEFALDSGPTFTASAYCGAYTPDFPGVGMLFDDAVRAERADEFAAIKALIALRTQPAVSQGDMRWMSETNRFIAYARTLPGSDSFIVTHSLTSGQTRRVVHSLEENVVCGPGTTQLPVPSATNTGVGLGSGVPVASITNHGLVTRADRPGIVSSVTRCTPATEAFSDVVPSNSYYDAVAWASSWGIVNGSSSSVYGASDAMSRGDAIESLFRFKAPPSPPACDPTIYHDVGTGSRCVATTWAVQRGILTGVPGGNAAFNPTANLTRQEAAKWLHRLAGEPAAAGSTCTPALPRTAPPTTTPCYDTYGITGGAANAIRWIGYTPLAPGTPVATGDALGSFNAAGPLTRSTFASWLYSFDRQPNRAGGLGNP